MGSRELVKYGLQRQALALKCIDGFRGLSAVARRAEPLHALRCLRCRVGNTSSASIPLALTDVQRSLRPDDKLVLCSVGAGLTTAAISFEW